MSSTSQLAVLVAPSSSLPSQLSAVLFVQRNRLIRTTKTGMNEFAKEMCFCRSLAISGQLV